MLSEWTQTTLEALSRSVSYGYTESASSDPIGPHFLRITDIQNGVVDWSSVPYCPISGKNHQKYKLKGGDIVVARTGNSTGENYFFAGDHDAVFASYLIRFSIDETLALPKFVWYTMRSPNWWAFVNQSKTGSAQAGANAKILGRFPIDLPPLSEQSRIAHILGSLDDKIELNRRMNATLIGMAQALFKSWFVDFAPVLDNALAAGNPIPDVLAARAEVRRQALANGTADREAAKSFPDAFLETEEFGWIPAGWNIHKMSDVADLTWGDTQVTKKSYTAEGYTAYSAKGPDGFLSYYDFDKVGIVLSAIGSNSGQSFLAHGKWSCIKNTIRLWANDSDDTSFYLYHVVSAPSFWPLRGSAQPFISQSDARNCRCLVPEREITREFGSMVADLYRKTWDNESQNVTLCKLRDILLPKLITGELSIADAEQLSQSPTA